MSEENSSLAGAGLQHHPVWKIIQSYSLEDKRQCQLAFLVYMDLCEAKGWWNLKTHMNKDLGLTFLSGHASRNKPREIILPLSAESELSPALVQRYIQTLAIEGFDTFELTLGICSSDSSTVYYKVTDGLVLPESPEMSEWKRYRREEKPRLQREHVSGQRDLYVQSTDNVHL